MSLNDIQTWWESHVLAKAGIGAGASLNQIYQWGYYHKFPDLKKGIGPKQEYKQ